MKQVFPISDGVITVVSKTDTAVTVEYQSIEGKRVFTATVDEDKIVLPSTTDNDVLVDQFECVGDGWFWEVSARSDWALRVLYVLLYGMVRPENSSVKLHLTTGMTECGFKNKVNDFEVHLVGRHCELFRGKERLLTLTAPYSYLVPPIPPLPDFFPISGKIEEMGAQTYVGTKVLHAVPMTRGDYNRLRNWVIPEEENPNEEGYLVQYADNQTPNCQGFTGYISWSPADVFKKAYLPVVGATK